MSLLSNIKANADKLRFHTPAHGGKILIDFGITDVTELPYSDNLLMADGEISELEDRVAARYGAECAMLSTFGATPLILSAVYALRGGGFLVYGAAHISVFNGLRLANARAEVVTDLAELYKGIESGRYQTVIITSPDYFGAVLDLAAISAACRAAGVALIVDAAHGAHFAFYEGLPANPAEYGDITILGLHKTLPVATGAAALTAAAKHLPMLRAARGMFHSTSPSYPILTSVENAFSVPQTEFAEVYTTVFAAIEEFIKELHAPFKVAATADISRLVVTSPYNADSVSNALFNAGIVAETAYLDKVVFIVTPYNYEGLGRLAATLNGLTRLPLCAESEPKSKSAELQFEHNCELVPLDCAAGRRAYRELGLYPPGTPTVYSGAIISAEDVMFIKNNIKRAFGLDNGRVFVLK